MHRLLSYLGFLLFACLVIPVAQAQRVALAGYLINAQGKPVSNATLTMSGKKTASVKTDKTGLLQPVLLTPGTYRLSAQVDNKPLPGGTIVIDSVPQTVYFHFAILPGGKVKPEQITEHQYLTTRLQLTTSHMKIIDAPNATLLQIDSTGEIKGGYTAPPRHIVPQR